MLIFQLKNVSKFEIVWFSVKNTLNIDKNNTDVIVII